MWPQIIGSVATGLSGLIVAVAGLVAARSHGAAGQLRACQEEQDRGRRQLVACIRHLYRLERILADTGRTVPQRPQEIRNLVS